MPSKKRAQIAEPLRGPVAKRPPRALGLMRRYQADELALFAINPLDVFPERTVSDFAAFSMLCSADLWRPLSAACGPCDGMVEGKHRKARLFCFDAGSNWILCFSETGDKGSSWFWSPKDDPALPKQRRSLNTIQLTAPGSPWAHEARGFFDSLLLGMALAHPPTMERLLCMPAIRAAAESAQIGEELASPARQGAKLRI